MGMSWTGFARDVCPRPIAVTDPVGHASAAFSYQLELGPRATSSPIDIAVPLHGGDLNLTLLPGR